MRAFFSRSSMLAIFLVQGCFSFFGQAGASFTHSIHLDSPLNYQVLQRMDRWTGRVEIRGTLRDSISGTAMVQYRFLGAGLDETWRECATLSRGETRFRARVNLRAGGWYKFEIRVVRLNTILAESVVEHVGVGEVFVIAGQSNSANHGEERLKSQTGRVATFGGKEWMLSEDQKSLIFKPYEKTATAVDFDILFLSVDRLVIRRRGLLLPNN